MLVAFLRPRVIHWEVNSPRTPTLHKPGSVSTEAVAGPSDHTWPRSRLAEANNTSHVQVSINRRFDGSCWEFQGGGGGREKVGCMLGYLASQAGGGVGGGAWSSLGTRGERSWQCWGWECFYRSRRVTTLEPRRTLAAVSGEAERVSLDGVRHFYSKRARR